LQQAYTLQTRLFNELSIFVQVSLAKLEKFLTEKFTQVEKKFHSEIAAKDIRIEELMGQIKEKDKVINGAEAMAGLAAKKMARLSYDASVSRQNLVFGQEVQRI
jgi:hypothetical protein